MAITRLSVINAMLSSLGMAALTANDSQHPRYVQASAKIDELTGQLQNRGWWFNRSTRLMQQNAEGEIPFATDVVQIDPVDRTKTYVMRNLKLYNITDSTFIIGKDVECTVTWQLDFVEMPPAAQVYLKDLSRYTFYLDQDGSEPKLKEYKALADAAWEALKQEHLKNAQVNFFDGAHNAWFRSSYHPVNRIIARQ